MLSVRELELLQLVHARPGITRAEAAAALAASSGTVTGLVRSLTDGCLLDEQPAAPSGTRGRPTRTLLPHPQGPLVLVAVVSHDSWRLTVSELGGTVIAVEERGHAGKDGPTFLIELRRAAAALGARFGGRVRGTGVALPGVVRGTVLVDAPLLHWQSLDFAAMAPVRAGGTPGQVFVVGNDATFAAQGEAVRGAAASADLHLHLYLDAGLGGALTHRGVVVPGAQGLAGEFGHMPFGEPGVPCPCGASGCWTTAVGALPLARLLGETLPDDALGYAARIVARARQGDRAAVDAMTGIAASLGRGIAGLVNGLDVDVVTLGGWAPDVAELVPDALREAYTRGLMAFRRSTPPPLLIGRLGAEAPRIGAQEQLWSKVWAML